MSAPALPDLKPLSDAFSYLDDLRESGVTNMMGAGGYLTAAFGYERAEARAILVAWRATFSDEPAVARASAALSA